MKVKADVPRTLAEMLDQHPALKMIEDVALITTSNDQIWFYWISRIGAGKVIDICRAASPKARAEFGLVQPKLAEAALRLEMAA